MPKKAQKRQNSRFFHVFWAYFLPQIGQRPIFLPPCPCLCTIYIPASHINPSPIRKIPLFDLSEIDFVISNFLCQNVQTTVREGGFELSLSVQTFCVHTCLMGGGSAEFWTMSKIWKFFFMAPLNSIQ